MSVTAALQSVPDKLLGSVDTAHPVMPADTVETELNDQPDTSFFQFVQELISDQEAV